MLKAIKIQLYLNDDQIDYMNNLFGTSRFIYNKLLANKIEQYNKHNKSVTFAESGKYLTSLKDEFEWIKNSHSKVLQQSLINLEQAYKNFFINNSGFPKFKNRKGKQSVRFPKDAIGKIKGNRINIIKQLKNIHFKCSKKDEKYLNKNRHLIKSATLSRTKTNKYYFSILIDKRDTKTLKESNNIVGIDLGINDFIVTSKNENFENIKIKRSNEKKLKLLHRELSRKNGTKNKEKSRIKLAKFYEKLNNKKEYYLHSIVNQLLNENQVIVIEDLSIKDMLQNKYLAKSIQELSLYRFKEILKYKAEWYGRDIIEVDRYFPSTKLCSHCGEKNTELQLSDRIWTCKSCNSTHNRDYNAALNLMNEGKRILNIKNVGLSSPELTLMEITSLDESLK